LKNKLILLIFFLTINSVIFSEQLKLIGNYIQLSVSRSDGKFLLYGRNSIKDKWIPLTFENFPSTSYFKMFYHDGTEIKFGQSEKEISVNSKISGDDIIYNWQNKNIRLELDYKLIRENDNSSANALIINFTISNLTEKDIIIDYYYCIDTYLGEKSKKHFTLPGNITLNSEKEFLSADIPPVITSYDDKSNLGIDIFFYQNNNIKPTRIYFANWKHVSEFPGFYKIQDGRSFDLKPYSINDSAVFADYMNQKVTAKNSIKYQFLIKSKNVIVKDKEPEIKIQKPVPTEEPKKITPKTDIQKTNIPKTDTTKQTQDIQPKITKPDLSAYSTTDLLNLINDINLKLASSENLSVEDIENYRSTLEAIRKKLNKSN
jgi:hypothetical protein